MLEHRQYQALNQAIRDLDKNKIIELINAGVDPNDYAHTTEPALFVAIRTGRLDIVNLLLDAGADYQAIYQCSSAHRFAETNHYPHIAEILPRVKAQDWLIERLQSLDIRVSKDGICFAIGYLTLLLDENLVVIALNELRKIPLTEFAKCMHDIDNIYQGLVQKVKDAHPGNSSKIFESLLKYQIDPSVLAQLTTQQQYQLWYKIKLNNLIKKLDDKTYYLLQGNFILTTIGLLSYPDTHKAIFKKEAWYKLNYWFSNKQEKYIHQSLNFLLPLEILKSGGLRCMDHYSGIYYQQELENSFNHLQTLLNQYPLQNFLSLIIKGNHHTLHYKFKTDEKPVLVDINNHPIASTGNQDLSKYLRSENGIVTFSTLVYTTGNDERTARQILSDWQQSVEWVAMHQSSAQRMNLKTSNHETWYDNVESGGNLTTYRTLANNHKDLQFLYNALAGVLAFVLGNVLLNKSTSNLEIGLSLVLASMCYFFLKKSLAFLSEMNTRAIASNLQEFNRTQQQAANATQIIKIQNRGNTFFQMPRRHQARLHQTSERKSHTKKT